MRSDHIIDARSTPRRQQAGSIGPYIAAFTEQLIGLRYAPSTIREHVRLVHRFDRCLARQRVELADLQDTHMRAFLQARPTRRDTRRHGGTSRLGRLLDHLRALGAIPMPSVVLDQSPRGELERAYREYLRAERGLCATTIANYLTVYRHFPEERLGEARPVDSLTAGDVSALLRAHARDRGPATAKMMVTALRALCRFVFQRGTLLVDLSAAVPTIPDWRLATIPKAIPPDDVERLLRACDVKTATGRRTHAVLLLLARLGLRAGEVVALELDDIDWRTGEISIRGKKGLRHDRFPWPADVGHALATYARRDRPPNASRRVAPGAPLFASIRGRSLSRDAIERMVPRYTSAAAEHCASLKGKRVTPHVLRHGTAMELLRHGVDRSVIALWLGHESVETTQMYLHADLRLKEEALSHTTPLIVQPARYRPSDQLLAFLKAL